MVFALILSFVLAACSAPQQQTQQTPPAQPSQPSQQTQTPAPEAPKLRFAMVLPGTVQDADFNFIGYQALLEAKSSLGVEFKYQENVAPADAERVARGFINDGYNVIGFHGGQFVTQVQKLAPDFPNVNFIAQAAGPVQGLPGNVWIIGRRWFEGYYPIGVLAAGSTKTGKIGVLAGTKLPDFVATVHAIRAAVAENNPKAQVVYSFIGDQNNPVAARQAATAMAGEGVDFIIMLLNLGTYGALEAVKDKPVMITTFMTDKHDMAPKNQAVSLLADFSVPFKDILTAIGKGQRSGYYDMRPGKGMTLSRATNVPSEAVDKAKAAFDKIAKKEFQVPEITKALD